MWVGGDSPKQMRMRKREWGYGMGAKEEQGQNDPLFPYSYRQFLDLEAEILCFLHLFFSEFWEVLGE